MAQHLGVGGAERVFVQVVDHLRSVRAVPVVVQARAPLARELEVAAALRTLATGDGRLPPERAWEDRRPSVLDRLDEHMLGQLVSLPIKALRLRRIVRTDDAVLVSTFLPKSHLVAVLARAAGTPVRVHVANVHCFMSQHLRHHFPAPLRPLARWVLGLALRRADAVFAVSERVREDLVATLGLDPARVHVVWNPLDGDRVRRLAEEPVPELPPAAPGTSTVVGVGRLTWLKAFHLAVEAMARLSPSSSTRLVLVGDGPERGELEALARRLGLGDRVVFVGEQSNPWRFMARADALVHPSRTEAFPNVFGEAMALGLPVVAAASSPGVAEYLEDGGSGILVAPDDPDALARALEELLADPERRESLGARGRRRVERFRPERTVAAYDGRIADLVRGTVGESITA